MNIITSLLLLGAVTVHAQDVNSIFFRFYKREGNNITHIDRYLPDAVEHFSSSWYNQSISSVFYLHGFLIDTNLPDAVTTTSALVRGVNFNVFAVDWREFSYHEPGLFHFATTPLYLKAAGNTQIVGEAIAEVLNSAIAQGLFASKKAYFIGHSLGAHVCGRAARGLVEKPSVIMALDPAGPDFGPDNAGRVTANDALTVQVLHTDAGVLGTVLSEGSANFFFNGGIPPQPGCLSLTETDLLCSHDRAWRYMSEAILRKHKGLARQCASLEAFQSNTCNNNTIKRITFPPDKSAIGTFYLETNSDDPYLKGLAGTRP